MRKSLLGSKFGLLTVMEYIGVKNGNSYWKCSCDCGNTVTVSRPNLLKAKSCGCLQSTSLIGKKFGKLLVVDSAGKRHNTTYWVCKCDCTKIVVARRGHLTDGGTKSCGCLRRGKLSPHWTGYGDISGGFYHRIQEHAKRRKLKFDVGIDYLWRLFQKQNGKCALSGLDLELPPDNKAWREQGHKTASLDRIDPTKGYIKGNVQWVHKDVNMMKQRFGQEYFISLCNLISERNKNEQSRSDVR